MQGLHLDEAQVAAVRSSDQVAWTRAENCAVLRSLIGKLRGVSSAAGGLTFDKDDDDAMDFVCAASNLRSEVFSIAMQSRFHVKSIAGNIIPAIATTNSIVAAQMTLEAWKVVKGDLQACKETYVANVPLARRLLTSNANRAPNPLCPVCSKAQVCVCVCVSVCVCLFVCLFVCVCVCDCNFFVADVENRNLVLDL